MTSNRCLSVDFSCALDFEPWHLKPLQGARYSTGHRVVYIIMTGLMHPETEKENLFVFILRSTGAAVSAVGAIAQALRRSHQIRSLHSLTKHLKSLLFNCVMDWTSLDWDHLFKNGLSCDKTSRCYYAIFVS